MAATEDQTQKRDGGKPKMSRFPLRAVTAVVRVLEFGKWKYGKWGGWQGVDNAVERYTDAFFRHVADLSEYGLSHTDEESGLPTLAHAVCDGVFLLWFTVKSDPGQPWLKAANTDDKEKLCERRHGDCHCDLPPGHERTVAGPFDHHCGHGWFGGPD